MSDGWINVSEGFKEKYTKAYAYQAPVWSDHLKQNTLCTVGFISRGKRREPYKADSLMDAACLGNFHYLRQAKEAVIAHLVMKALKGRD